MDKELTTIREFVTFANEMLSGKSIDNMYRLVAKPETLTPLQCKEIKATFSTYFSNIVEWKDFKGKIVYKIGEIDMAKLEKTCLKKTDDAQVFTQYLDTIRAFYFDVRKNINEFIKKLGLEEGSNEAVFMTTVFNDIGGELIETIKSGGDTKDVATLLPRVFEMLKNGSLVKCLERLKDGSIKVSKILRAITTLVEQWEGESAVQVEGSVSSGDVGEAMPTTTLLLED
uniref:Uncharacterized protein n=1 Tax=viral metagenome TaxID=1070528 RepID=A0A6C0JWT3_9ZZZZ